MSKHQSKQRELSAYELAGIWGVTAPTIYAWSSREQGALPSHRRQNGRRYYVLDEAEKWFSTQTPQKGAQ